MVLEKQWDLEMIIVFGFLVGLLLNSLVSCSTIPRSNDMLTEKTFCEQNFGKGAEVSWNITAEPIPDGVAHSIKTFQCAFIKGQNNVIGSDVDCEKRAEPPYEVCYSKKKYDLKVLCANQELKRYWESPGPYERTCEITNKSQK